MSNVTEAVFVQRSFPERETDGGRNSKRLLLLLAPLSQAGILSAAPQSASGFDREETVAYSRG